MGIPDRWLKYDNMGLPIRGTRFIAFKVPLKQEICRNLDRRYRFTPEMLIDNCVKLGMIIDLTFTKRYYSSTIFTSRGIQYHKILCPGRVVPSKPLVDQFFMVVDEFLQNNRNKESLIGVHCTHGLNRTSVFVCKYMIQRLGFKPSEAIREFESARGHAVERKEYIDDIFNTKQLVPLVISNTPKSCNRESSFHPKNKDQKNWRLNVKHQLQDTYRLENPNGAKRSYKYSDWRRRNIDCEPQ